MTNNSEGRSNYIIDVVAESPDGSVQYDSSMASAMNVEPGQTTEVEAPFLKDIPADAVLKVKSVSRTASS